MLHAWVHNMFTLSDSVTQIGSVIVRFWSSSRLIFVLYARNRTRKVRSDYLWIIDRLRFLDCTDEQESRQILVDHLQSCSPNLLGFFLAPLVFSYLNVFNPHDYSLATNIFRCFRLLPHLQPPPPIWSGGFLVAEHGCFCSFSLGRKDWPLSACQNENQLSHPQVVDSNSCGTHRNWPFCTFIHRDWLSLKDREGITWLGQTIQIPNLRDGSVLHVTGPMWGTCAVCCCAKLAIFALLSQQHVTASLWDGARKGCDCFDLTRDHPIPPIPLHWDASLLSAKATWASVRQFGCIG